MRKLWAFMFFLGVCWSSLAWAVETRPSDDRVFRELDTLEKLRSENPQAYREQIEAKRTLLQQRFSTLRQAGGGRYGEFLQKRTEERRVRLDRMRTDHPRHFRRFWNEKMQHVQELAQRHPDRVRALLADHPRFRERLAAFQEISRGAAGGPRLEPTPGGAAGRTGWGRTQAARGGKGDEFKRPLRRAGATRGRTGGGRRKVAR